MSNRKILTLTKGSNIVIVYRNAEWDQYTVRIYPNGVLHAPADYFTDDKEDAIGTAQAQSAWLDQHYPQAPKVAFHYFDSTGEAYDACQWNESILSGDVLVIESECVVAIADTWPFAITTAHGELHAIADGYKAMDVYPQFADGISLARQYATAQGWPQ